MTLKRIFSALIFFSYLQARAQPGNALDFDGSNDIVVMPGVPSFLANPGANDITIEGWINPRGSVFARILFAQVSTSNFVSFGTAAGNVIYFYVIENGTTHSIATSAGIPQNQWTHVAVRWIAGSGALSVFFNGVLQTGGGGGSSSTGTNGLALGSRTGGFQHFNGAIDELRVWNEARSDCNILFNMNNSITTTQPNLALNYHFDQGIAGGANGAVTTLPDFSGSAATGTLTNFALSGSSSNWIASTATLNTTGVAFATTNTQTAAICSGAGFTFPNGVTQTNITASFTHTSNISVGSCSRVFITTLTVNANPTITVNSGGICSGQSFTLSPSGANTYTVQGGNYTVTPTANASYTVTGTSTTGCVSQLAATSNVTVNPNPTITVNSGSICAGNAFNIIPAGANTYTIEGGSNIVSPAANSSYTVAGTSTAGCLSQLTATSIVIVHANPTIAVNSGSICAGQSFVISPSGASTYTVQGGSNAVTPVANASYTIAGTSTAGCVSPLTATSTVIVHANPTITVNSGSICAGSAFTMVPIGANTYTIQGSSSIVSPAANSSYTVAGTSTAGCLSQLTATSTVSVHANPTVTVNGGTICAGQSFIFSPSGASTYTIQGGSTTVTPAANTSYTLAGTSTAGCLSQFTATGTVIVNPNPTITVNSGTICAGQSFILSPSGANTYTVQGGSNTVSPMANTSYTVAGTSTAGCLSQFTATGTVIVNPNPTITVNSGSICAGQSFVISPSGANTYTVQGGSFTVTPTVNTSYTVAGTSIDGCASQLIASSNIIVNANPTITANSGSICAGQSFVISPSGGNTYTVQGGSFTVSPTTTTSYTLSGQSIEGCIALTSALSTVSVSASPTVIITGNATVCLGEQVTLTGSGADAYLWSNGNSGISTLVYPTATTVYTASGTFSTSGCSATGSLSIMVDQCTGISHNAVSGSSVKIYPNPNSGQFFIELPAACEVIVTDMVGSIVYKEQCKPGKTQIRLNSVAKGIYNVSAISPGGSSTYKLFVND